MQMRAFRVPPQAEASLRESPLRALFGLDHGIWDRDRVLPFIEALKCARPEQIAAARANIHYALDEVKRRSEDASFSYSGLFKHGDTFQDMVYGAIKDLSNDVETALRESDKNPRYASAHQTLKTAAAYLAEAMLFARNAADLVDANLTHAAEVAEAAWGSLAPRIDAYRDETAFRYEEVSKNIPSSADILASATDTVATTKLTAPHYDPRMVDDARHACGDQMEIWSRAGRAANPMRPAEIENLRTRALAAISAYDGVFNEKGFVADLLKAAVAESYNSLRQTGHAIEYTPHHVKNQKPFLYDSAEKHERRIEQDLEELPAKRAGINLRARESLAKAEEITSFLLSYQRAVHPDRISPVHIEFELRDGVLVGLPDDRDLDALLVYDDTTSFDPTAGRLPTIVLAACIRREDLESGIPTIDKARLIGTGGSNFHTVEQCIAELSSDTAQSHFFKGRQIASHNAVSALAAGQLGAQQRPKNTDAQWNGDVFVCIQVGPNMPG